MAFSNFYFGSSALGIDTGMGVIIPNEAVNGDIPMSELKVIYLLHGLSDDHTIWSRNTSVERYANDHKIAVVMPNGGRSFYTDMKKGYKYFEHIANEVPSIARRVFGFSCDRNKNFIAGLSMGGFGAFKIALAYPERFMAAGSFSGVLWLSTFIEDYIAELPDEEESIYEEMENIFGEGFNTEKTENDLIFMLESLVKNGQEVPKLYQWCGTEDFLYGGNAAFKKAAKSLNAPLTYSESVGDHAWVYWDTQIKLFMDFIDNIK